MARALLTISLTISIFLLLIFLVFTVTTAHRISKLPHSQSSDSSDVASFFKAKLVEPPDRSPAELLQDTGQLPGNAPAPTTGVVSSSSWSERAAADDNSGDSSERRGEPPQTTSQLFNRPSAYVEASEVLPSSSAVDAERFEEEKEDRIMPEQPLLPPPPPKRRIPITSSTTTTTVVYDKLEGEEEEEEEVENRQQLRAPLSSSNNNGPATAVTAIPHHRSRSSAQMKQMEMQDSLVAGGGGGHRPPNEQQQQQQPRPNMKELLMRYIEQKAAQARAETMNQEGASAAVSSQLNRAKSPPEMSPIRAFSSSSSSRGAPVSGSGSGSSGEIEDDDDERHSLLFDQQQQQQQSLQPPPPPPVPPQYLPPVVHRNLTSSSQRIAKNFQDLNAAESGGARISRFNLPSTDQNSNGANNNGNGGGGGGGGGKLQCGEAVTIDTNYELSSPNFPDKYPPNMDCSWEITATRQKILRVQIFKLNIEQEQNCRFDYLDIIGVISTDPKTGKVHQKTKRYCGTYVRQEIAIGANRTAITFHSDSSTELAGFHIRVIAESQDCLKAVAVFNSSTLTSPQYPLSYEDSKNCWTVVAAQLPDHRLLVQFEVLRLEPDVKCALDYVELFDGAVAEGGKSLGRFCQLPANASLAVYSSGPRLLVHFQSDNFLALLGYKARITALRRDVDMAGYASCNWSADWANMTISSPFYPKRYPAGTRCETSISALLPTERIIILFDWIDLVDEGALSRRVGGGGGGGQIASSSVTTYRHNCSADRLEIWESVNDTTPSRVLCGYRSQPLKYVSAGNSIRLVFRSADEDDEGGGAASTSLQEATAVAAAKNRRRTEAVGISNPGFKARFTFTPSNSIQGSSGTGSGGGQYPPKRHGNGHPNQQQSHQPPNHHHRLPPPPPSSPSSSKTNFNTKPNADDQQQQQPPPSPPPLEPVLLRRPENASVRLGSSHVLHCELEQPLRGGGNSNGGQQNPLQAAADRLPIVWFKGDREIHEGVSADGSSLLIRAFRPNSAGRYICVYGDGDHSADAWLTLRPDSEDCRTATSVLFRERPKDQFTSEGEFVMLHCSVTLANADGSEVDTEAKISWERMPLSSSSSSSSVVDGQMVANSSPQPVQYNSRIKVLRRGDLLFDPALSEDSGFYFCVVRPNEDEEEGGEGGRREDKEEVAKEAGTEEQQEPQQQQPSAPRTSIVTHLSNGTLITTTTVDQQQQQQKRSRSIASEQQQQQQQQQPSTTGKTVDCAIKSAARVQINQRVDVSQFCGRSFLQRGQNGNGQNGGGNGGKPPSMSDVGKIIGGTEAEPGEFPWMVMFWDEKRHVFCGGALLNERWILTAAHCFTDIADESTVFVKLGKYDQTAAEPTEAVTKIAHIIKHPHFSNETFDNDIALVKLVQHITFTDYIAPICLPSSSEEVAAMDAFFFGVVETENGNGKESAVVPVNSGGQTDAETKFGYVSGWGRLKENGPLPRYLHKIRLPIVEDDRCHRSTSFKVTENMFCAGYGKEIVGDACKGDSGGPFAVQFANRWTLLGIVSWGEGCGRPEKYGYYTRVNNYSKWIRRLTRHNYQL